APLVWRRARIGDEAQPAQHAVTVEQRRQDDGMSGDARAGLAARIARLLDRLADIFILVVEAGIDLVQVVVFPPALGEIGPVVEFLPRRPSVAAAGQLAEAIEAHRVRLEPELEAADFSGIGSRLRGGRRARECNAKRDGAGSKRPGLRREAHCIISSSARTGACRCPRSRRNLRRSTRRGPPPWRTDI